MKTVYPPTNTVCGGYNKTHIYVEANDINMYVKYKLIVFEMRSFEYFMNIYALFHRGNQLISAI